MNISSSKISTSKSPAPARKTAQEQFQAAREEYDTRYSEYVDTFTSYQNTKERNILIGAAAGFVLGGAAMYYFGIPLQHGAELALPGIVGGGVGFAATWMALGGKHKQLQPQLAESFQRMYLNREALREELFKEMDDQGVRDITQPRWEQAKQSSSRQTPTLNDRVDALTLLADSRLEDGWTGELAGGQDDPLKFQEQQSFIVANPEVRQLLEK